MKSIRLEIKWALIFVCMMLVWVSLERVFGFHSSRIHLHAKVTNFVAITSILIYVLALRDKRKTDYGGTMTYVQGFKSGLIMTLIITLLSPFTQILVSTVISPHYFQNATQYAVDNQLMTPEQAAKTFNLKSYLLQTIIFTPVMGILTTAVVALFTKSKTGTSKKP